ncbi:hypothetical protein PG993_005341 [Apiospora rasikravindrae]|uniref:Ecp2 effector protein-like domain-containing protein n=1 Tax=Apiospora rasikravindrae TaxID=990691 RepID=A0ABR1TFC2_9PEZI
MKLYLNRIFVWALPTSAAHLGGGTLVVKRDGVTFSGDYNSNSRPRPNPMGVGYVWDVTGQTLTEAGPSVTKCEYPTFSPMGPSADMPRANWTDCQSITNYTDTDPNGHGQWKLPGSSGLDPLAASGNCLVGISQQAGSKAKSIEFGDTDLKNIVNVTQGKENSAEAFWTGSMKCGEAMIDFTVYGKQYLVKTGSNVHNGDMSEGLQRHPRSNRSHMGRSWAMEHH